MKLNLSGLLFVLALLLIAGCPKSDDAADGSPAPGAADGSMSEDGTAADAGGTVDHSQLEVPEETAAADEVVEQVEPADPELLLVHDMVHALNQFYGEGFRSAFHPDTPEFAEHEAFFAQFKTQSQTVSIQRLLISSADESNRYLDYEFLFTQNPGGTEAYRMSGCISVALDNNGDWKIVSWDKSGSPCPPPAGSEEPVAEEVPPMDPVDPPADGIGGGEGGAAPG